MPTSKHTPTPWIVREAVSYPRCWHLHRGDWSGPYVASFVREAEANQAAREHNTFEPMREALEALVDIMDASPFWSEVTWLERARAALALAEEE